MSNPNIPSIGLIPNQPFIFQPLDANCLGNDNRDYCVLVNQCDQIQIQEKLIFNTDCFEDLLACDSFLSSQYVTNGTFTGSAAGWTLGTNWAWSSTPFHGACATAITAGQTLSQNIASLTPGTYVLSYNIYNYESGDLVPTLGSTPGTTISADGFYSEFIVVNAGTILSFERDTGDFTGCIDDVSVKKIQCFLSDGWTFSNETACHTVGNEFPLVSEITLPASVSDCTYELKITITGMTTGSLTPGSAFDSFESITANGTYNIYFQSQGGAPLNLTPSSDFDGCVGLPELRAMCDYPQLALFDLDDNFIVDLSIDGGVSVDIEGQFITWTFKLCQLEQSVSYGCYKFKLFDPCNDCFLNENLITNPEFQTDLSGWDHSGGWAWDAANGGEVKVTAGTGFIEQNLGYPDAGMTRCIQINVLSVNPTLHVYVVNSGLGQEIETLNITSPGIYSLCGSGDIYGFSSLNASAEVGSFYVIDTESCNTCAKYCYQVESNCLNWQESHPCTKLIVAYCEENSLGFNFGSTVYVGTGFKLQQRFRVVNFNPKDDKDRLTALDSEGSRKLVFSQQEEIWQLRFDYCDRFAHACISKMMECDVIQINHGEINAYPTPYDNVKEYVCVSENYEPEWEERGRQKLAQSQVEVVEIPSATFNQNLT